MRKTLIMSFAAAGLLAAGALFSTAQAAPGAPSSGVADAARQNDGLKQDVALVCRRVWRNGFWQRRCFETGPGYGYGGGYGFYGPRPYYGGYGYGYGPRRGYWRRW